MLSDGGRLGDIGKNFRSNNVLQVFAFIALQIQVCFQNSVVYSGECQLNGNNLVCERLSLVRIPLEVEGLQGVESLILSSNLFSELLPHDITRLPQTLKKLDLTDNRLAKLNFEFLDAKLPDLRELVVSKNRMDAFLLSNKRNDSELIFLDLSYNNIESFRVESECLKLQKLDLKFNKLAFLPSAAFSFLPNLQHLDLSGNPIHIVPDFSFDHLKSLKVLLVNFMPLLSKIAKHSLFALPQLKLLEIRNNPRLETIDLQDLSPRTQLDHLDLSSNSIRHFTFPDDLGNLSFVDVSNNLLECDCFSLGSLRALYAMGQKRKRFNLFGFSCTNPNTNDSYWTLDDAVEGLREQCPDSGLPRPAAFESKIIAQIGEPLVIGCPGFRDSDDVMWLTNRKEAFARSSNDSSTNVNLFSNDSTVDTSNRFVVLSDGSLFVRKVLKSDGGDFICFSGRNFTNFLPASNLSFPHSVLSLRLDYTVLTRTSVASMLVGGAVAAGFFVVSAVLGAVRYAFNTCSRKEKRKRKSIREVLEKMSGFKTAQMGRFSAYRSAKMDKLLAFKSATMDQLYAFKTARVDKSTLHSSGHPLTFHLPTQVIPKLRTYKQATVTTILHHMDRMREHYAFQSSRVKENCSQQVDRLRETYDAGCGRFKDYRSQRVEKMRENYNSQVCKIREYGQLQLSRLREQYKTQQQYLLKLLELIDVGNCITVIEAECLKTESVIFDADITFDLEPRPIRMPEPSERPSEDPGSEDGMMEEGDRVDLEDFLEELRSFGDNEDDGAVGDFGIDECFCGVSYGDIDEGDDVSGDGRIDLGSEGSNLTLGKKMKRKFRRKKKIKKAVDTTSSSPPSPQITKDAKVKWSSRKKSKATLHSLGQVSVPSCHLQTKPNRSMVIEKTDATPPPDRPATSERVDHVALTVSQLPHEEGVEPGRGKGRDSAHLEYTGRRGDRSARHRTIDCEEGRSSTAVNANDDDDDTNVDTGTGNDDDIVREDACPSGGDGDRVVAITIHTQEAI